MNSDLEVWVFVVLAPGSLLLLSPWQTSSLLHLYKNKADTTCWKKCANCGVQGSLERFIVFTELPACLSLSLCLRGGGSVWPRAGRLWLLIHLLIYKSIHVPFPMQLTWRYIKMSKKLMCHRVEKKLMRLQQKQLLWENSLWSFEAVAGNNELKLNMNKVDYCCVCAGICCCCCCCSPLDRRAPLRPTGRNDSESLLGDFPGVWVHFLVQIRLVLL